jgi:ABC-type uncharacterized transport system involved in gliding motility auxiliary subunit
LTWQPKEGVEVVPLLQSSPDARLVETGRVQAAFDPRELLAYAAQGEGGQRAIAVRVSGKLSSAFVGGPPAGVENKDHLAQAQATANVVVVADVDLLGDDYWLQKQQFFQQMLVRPFADNGDMVVNGLDALAGSAELISIRSRTVYNRPFEVVNDLRMEAEQRFRSKEEELQARLDETERRLQQLRTSEDGQAVILTPEQQEALRKFQAEQLRIRKELREVRYQLDKDIQSLGMTLKLMNTGLVPVLVGVFGIVVAAVRQRRRRVAREAHRE